MLHLDAGVLLVKRLDDLDDLLIRVAFGVGVHLQSSLLLGCSGTGCGGGSGGASGITVFTAG
ncbi:hypothetical protein D3C75_1297210 [compost metagenome]